MTDEEVAGIARTAPGQDPAEGQREAVAGENAPVSHMERGARTGHG